MFLNSMSTDEKDRFLELAYKLAQIDGEYAEEEEEIINSYKAELGITDIYQNVKSMGTRISKR